MTIKIYQNIVTNKEIKILLDYYNSDDGIEYIDSRPDVFSKNPNVINDNWPKTCIKKIINRVLDSYDIETVVFNDSKDSFRLHVDSGDGDQKKIYKNILIPLYCEGKGSTIIFKNRWHGPSTRFVKIGGNPFSYRLPMKDGSIIEVPDIRDLSDLSKFEITRKELDNLIEKRSSISKNPPDKRTSDYSAVEGYDQTLKFNKELHEEWLKHIPIENLHGLTVKEIIKWNPGDVVVFDRQYLHCAGYGHKRKKGVSIFTNYE